MTALMLAAASDNSGTVKVLLEAGASTEAKDDVSKRISICTCVCVLYSCIIVCVISKKCRFKLFFYFIIVICRI